MRKLMKPLITLLTFVFVFWSGEIRVRIVGPHGQIYYETQYGLFRGNTETGEVKELTRHDSGRKGVIEWRWRTTGVER